jgi:hypothetical protein
MCNAAWGVVGFVAQATISTAANIEATPYRFPQSANTLIRVSIPSPLLHDPLQCLAIARTTP